MLRTSMAWAFLVVVLLLMAYQFLFACGVHLPGLGLLSAHCGAQAVQQPSALPALQMKGAQLQQHLAELQRRLVTRDDCRRKTETQPKPQHIQSQRIDTQPKHRPTPSPEQACSLDTDQPLDIFILQDGSKSFRDDQRHFVAMVRSLIAMRERGELGADVRFGYATFQSKPFKPFGTPGQSYVYALQLQLTKNLQALFKTVSEFKRFAQGYRLPESHFEAIIEALGDDIGYRRNSRRLMIIATDAPSEVAGNWKRAPAPEDGRADGDWLNEDFPSSLQVSQALKKAGVTPVFLVARRGAMKFFQRFVSEHGDGVVIPLSRDSRNILQALKLGIKQSCR